MRRILIATAIGAAFAAASVFAAPPDWSKVPARKINVFYPGVTSLEWVLGSEHSGARGIRKGETCAACHDEETAGFAVKIVAGEKLETDPAMAKGRAPSIPVTVQAAHDDTTLYMRFEWKPSAGGLKKIDEKNAAKLSVMLDDGKVEYANIGGCWAGCHDDLRSMPDVNADAPKHERAKEIDIRANGPTKYLKESRTALEIKAKPRGGWDKLKPAADYEALLKEGKFLEMWQWRSTESSRVGYVLEARRLKAVQGMAEGKNEGGAWIVTFNRKLAGGPGVHAIAPGRTYTIGFAIHDDHADWRFHDVSLGYTLALDDPKADVNAVKQ